MEPGLYQEHLIAGVYEIEEPIGEGGFGKVFKGVHTRLHIPIVIKKEALQTGERDTQDTIAAKKKELQQEVDTLKKLNHMYLPKVYDFIWDETEGVSYTIMDFIDGESLEKPLKRQEVFEQKTVIEWACQLLQALSYLHRNNVLHSDIKPPNIMLTPQGDIRLIDYNVALALGSEAERPRLGRSDGYAPPELYPEYSDGKDSAETAANTPTSDSSGRRSFYGTIGKYCIRLDACSDIYSLGATLYHLLGGVRPPKRGVNVPPLSQYRPDISPLVADIIRKAMNPNPSRRYQTAEEMLFDFEHLHTLDARARRHRALARIVGSATALLLLIGGAITFTGLQQMTRYERARTLAEYSGKALQAGDVGGAVSYALKALPEKRGLFDPPYAPEAQRALANATGVYDLSDGYKAFRSLTIPSEPIKASLSPDGAMVAVLLNDGGDWKVNVYDIKSQHEVASLPAAAAAMSGFAFRDERTLLYAGASGLTAYDLENRRELWRTETPATVLTLSADGETVASVYRNESFATIYRADTGERRFTVDFGEKHMKTMANDVFYDRMDYTFALNENGRRLAVSFSDGSLCLFPLFEGGEIAEVLPPSDYEHFESGFHDGCFAFVAYGSAENAYTLFAVLELSTMEVNVRSTWERPAHLQTNERGVFLSAENNLIQINPRPSTPDDVQIREVAHTSDDITAFVCGVERVMLLTADGKYLFYDQSSNKIAELTSAERIDFADFAGDYVMMANRDNASLIFQRWERHPDATLFSYDASYAHLEARVHTDRETAMLFEAEGGKAFRIIDREGAVWVSASLDDPDEIYDPQYRKAGETDFSGRVADADFLEIRYNDGYLRHYSAKTGELLSETPGAQPDGTLDQEFWTQSYHIVAPMHGRPVVYDRSGENKLGELENAFLAYAVQRGEYLIADYVNAEGERYSRLLDSDLNVIADLPRLCDTLSNGTLIFDDHAGHLRFSRIYSTQELLTLAKANR